MLCEKKKNSSFLTDFEPSSGEDVLQKRSKFCMYITDDGPKSGRKYLGNKQL